MTMIRARRNAALSASDKCMPIRLPARPTVTPLNARMPALVTNQGRSRWAQIDWTKNDPSVGPGDPYPFQGGTNPFAELRGKWTVAPAPVRGRVIGLFAMSALGLRAFSGATVGLAGSVIGIHLSLALSAALLLALIILMLWTLVPSR